MINNKFLFFKTYDAFKDKLEQGKINEDSIVFIKDKNFIVTHNTRFADRKESIFVSDEEYYKIAEPNDNNVYFITRGSNEPFWQFGDAFPVMLSKPGRS